MTTINNNENNRLRKALTLGISETTCVIAL